MCGKLNLSHLSAEECEQILHVVQRDSVLDHIEKQRLSQIKAEVEEEEAKSEVLSKYRVFNEKSCIRCFSRFFLFFNKKLVCAACRFYICKKCCELDNGRTKKTLCKACYKERLLAAQSNEWFYSALNRKFKHSGTAKVIRNLYGRQCFGNTVDIDSSHAFKEASVTITDIGLLPFTDISHAFPDTCDTTSRSKSDVNPDMSKKLSRHGDTSDDVTDDPDVTQSAGNRSDWLAALGCSADVESAERLVAGLPGGERLVSSLQGQKDVQSSSEETLSSLSGNILRLVEGVSKTQGQVTTTASRMMKSADTMSSLYEELDELDRKLDCLEEEVDEVVEDSRDDADADDDVIVQSIYDDYKTRESTAEALGIVTSAALQLLCSQRGDTDEYMSSDSAYREVFERISGRDESPSPVDSLTEDNSEENSMGFDLFHPVTEVSCSSEERLPGSDRRGATKERRPGGHQREQGHGFGAQRKAASVTPKQGMGYDGVKRTEEKIYLTSGKVFTLEDRIKELEQQVLMVDTGACSEEDMARLENEIARAVAHVSQSDHEVCIIEENLQRRLH